MKNIEAKNSLSTVNNQKGQLSIFLSVLLIVIFTLIAFIVNVGLFVKAKINLQNAVDSAAWSGAAVQARQLSNIAYLNWEMRNNYKEWMFKYYVMGQVSNPKTHSANIGGLDKIDFRLKRFDESGTSIGDRYNLPATCIHFASTHNICEVYQVPGLPRFQVVGLANVSEYFEGAVDAFAQTKAKNCSDRTNYNFSAAMSYAYSTGDQRMEDVPIVAGYRVGAWIKSIELSLRMRNLEMIVNRPPIEGEICEQGCQNPTQNLHETDNSFGYSINERPLKAYAAAFKTLSGGNFQDYFKRTLKITELKPSSYQAIEKSLSNFLIPNDGFNYPGGEMATKKHYVDLIPMIANYATFFSSFSARSGNIQELGIPTAGSVTTEASCASTKTAMPVPGYVIGFMKNPQVMTYYPVKAEASFVGLFNPFTQEGINLKAYAIAKPFGGRIGPSLLVGKGPDTKQWTNLYPRDKSGATTISANYLFSFDTSGDSRITSADKAGLPIPNSSDFYISGADGDNVSIGGTPASNTIMKFAIPNLIYTLPGVNPPDLIPNTSYYPNVNSAPVESAGLYDANQYKAFRKALPPGIETAATMSVQEIEESIEKIRGPTDYDIANYMVPLLDGNGDSESIPSIKPLGETNRVTGTPYYSLFAPLYGNNTLYPSKAIIDTVISSYVDSLAQSVEVYLEALKDASDSMRNAATQSGTGYTQAADSIYESAGLVSFPPTNCATVSIASKFNFFFTGRETEPKPENCGMIPLSGAISNYVYNLSNVGNLGMFYNFSFKMPPEMSNQKLSTAYMPGIEQGASQAGEMVNPLNPSLSSVSMKRAQYSTKFISAESIRSSASGYSEDKPFIYIENPGNANPGTSVTPSEFANLRVLNVLEPSELNDFGSDPKY